MPMEIYGREVQYKALIAAFGKEPLSNLPSTIFLWGMPATGKTFVLNKSIEEVGILHTSRISASEVMCGKRPFFETLLRQLQPNLSSDIKCDNPRLFLRHLSQIVSQENIGKESRVIIILDEAEYLRKEHPDLLNIFANLQEVTQGNICVVISSFLPPSSFSSITSMRSIPTFHFPQYSKEDMITIITKCYAPPEPSIFSSGNPKVFSFYVNMVVNVFYQNCRDLKKLLRLTKSNWNHFQTNANLNDQNLHKLWKNIEPRLKEEFKALSSNILPMPGNKTDSLTTSRNYSDIPKYSRYLLISSYLATHNPASSDKRFFVKGGSRKTTKSSRYNIGGGLNKVSDMENSDKTNMLRSFDLNRLKAIFAFMVHYCSGGTENFEPNADILMQISTLCHAKFLQNLGEDTSGNFKYRCLADYDFILEIAKSVDFELDKYLYRLL